MQNGELRPLGHRTIHRYNGANALKQELNRLVFHNGIDSVKRALNEIVVENGEDPLFYETISHTELPRPALTANGHDHSPTSRSLGAHAGWATKRAVTELMVKNPDLTRDAALEAVRGQQPAPQEVVRIRPRNFKKLKKGQKSWFTRVQKFIDAEAAHGTVLDWATAEKRVHAQWIENRGTQRKAA